ncbi:hypothetical protein Cch01nite_08160 [Cellulomonas chitinilytica]|uniref:Sel1 repeat family protein n=1 Tax=Cellulomonas chitinilytica TaxID=398759 RepID=A0A919U123_9CELL|nr:hypothetical protein [Cellulomonas chitinilytica]GIG20092.1 hypothetical protein Cch01nite_08160 [Cellulomonas chitinilytica]
MIYVVLVVSFLVSIWRALSPMLVTVAAILSIVALITGNGGLMTTVWWLWGIGVAGLVVRWMGNRGKYRNLEELDAASRAGVPRAMRARASLHKLNGEVDEAERLLRAAVDAGDRESMWDMGRLVEERDGLAASEPWFRMAAERGHLAAKRFFAQGHALNLDGSNPL